MNLPFNKRRPIIIMELSSTTIKFLQTSPYSLAKEEKRCELRRFYSDSFYNPIPIQLINYVEENIINIERYKNKVLPIIVRHFERLLLKNPQQFFIGATGIYRNIKNSEEIKQLIEDELSRISGKKRFSFKIISIQEESRLSFLSFINTYCKFGSKGEKRIFKAVFETQTGLNIDIGGGTTEVSIVKAMNFAETISIPIGADTVFDEIKLNRVDSELLRRKAKEIGNIVSKELISFSFSKQQTLSFCVCTGSTISNEKGIENCVDVESITNIEALISSRIDLIERISQYLLLKRTKKKSDEYDFHLRKFAGLTILKEVFLFFGINEYYMNLANLRIGMYFDVYNKIAPRGTGGY